MDPSLVRFRTTIADLRKTFPVSTLSEQAVTWDGQTDPRDLFTKNPDYDQFPIQRNGSLSHVLERDESNGGHSERPLSPQCIVKMDTSIEDAIDILVREPYLIAVPQDGAVGIVTRSDLLKLPVRLIAYCLITSLEQLMAQLIVRHRSRSEDWLIALAKNDRNEVLDRFFDLKKDRREPNLVELTQFRHKAEILGVIFSLNPRSRGELQAISDTRNHIMHGRDYADTWPQLKAFARSLQAARDWIGRLAEVLDGEMLVQPSAKAAGAEQD